MMNFIIYTKEYEKTTLSQEERQWYVDGKLHRIGGPAIEKLHIREWRNKGKLHREDGPAVESIDNLVYGGYKYWIDGKPISNKKDFLNIMNQVDSLDPILGLIDPKEWIRNRWEQKLKLLKDKTI